MSAAFSVKNTFLDMREEYRGAQRRNKSLPPSFRPACGTTCGMIFEWNEEPAVESDVSTDVRTEASDDESPSSEMGNVSSDSPSVCSCYVGQCEPCMGVMFPGAEPMAPMPPWVQVSHLDASPMSYVQPTSPLPEAQVHRLNSKALAFQPSPQLRQASEEDFGQVADMVHATKTILQNSRSVASVDVTQTFEGWSIVIAPQRKHQVSVDRAVAVAKDALLKAAQQSSNVYVLGYCAPHAAFEERPQGFEAQLGLMGSAEAACWRVFKRGSCHHGTDCCKEHPILQVPVHVYVEAAHFAAQEQVVCSFKEEVASFVMMVTSMLTGVAAAQAFNDQDGQGWRVEVSLRAEDMCFKENFLTVVKNALMEAAQLSQNVYIMGTGAKPFISKSQGFTTMLGEMADRTQACWDLYMKGCCWRGDACRWRHPQCLMPVNVVLKQMEAS